MISALIENKQTEVFADFPPLRSPYGYFLCPVCKQKVSFRRCIDRIDHFYHDPGNPSCPNSVNGQNGWNHFLKICYNFFSNNDHHDLHSCRTYVGYFLEFQNYNRNSLYHHVEHFKNSSILRAVWAQLYFFPSLYINHQHSVDHFLKTLSNDNGFSRNNNKNLEMQTFIYILKTALNNNNTLECGLDGDFFIKNYLWVNSYVKQLDSVYASKHQRYCNVLLNIITGNNMLNNSSKIIDLIKSGYPDVLEIPINNETLRSSIFTSTFFSLKDLKELLSINFYNFDDNGYDNKRKELFSSINIKDYPLTPENFVLLCENSQYFNSEWVFDTIGDFNFEQIEAMLQLCPQIVNNDRFFYQVINLGTNCMIACLRINIFLITKIPRITALNILRNEVDLLDKIIEHDVLNYFQSELFQIPGYLVKFVLRLKNYQYDFSDEMTEYIYNFGTEDLTNTIIDELIQSSNLNKEEKFNLSVGLFHCKEPLGLNLKNKAKSANEENIKDWINRKWKRN